MGWGWCTSLSLASCVSTSSSWTSLRVERCCVCARMVACHESAVAWPYFRSCPFPPLVDVFLSFRLVSPSSILPLLCRLPVTHTPYILHPIANTSSSRSATKGKYVRFSLSFPLVCSHYSRLSLSLFFDSRLSIFLARFRFRPFPSSGCSHCASPPLALAFLSRFFLVSRLVSPFVAAV